MAKTNTSYAHITKLVDQITAVSGLEIPHTGLNRCSPKRLCRLSESFVNETFRSPVFVPKEPFILFNNSIKSQEQ